MTFALGFVLGAVAAALVFLGASVLRLADAASRLAGAVEVHGNQLSLFGRVVYGAGPSASAPGADTIADPDGSAMIAGSDAARRSVP